MPKKPLDRRMFLQGAGGVFIALPFLEAMLPALAYAQSTQVKRFVTVYAGMPTSRYSVPSAPGPWSTMPMAFQSLDPIKHLFSLVSGLDFPTYNTATGAATAPGSAYNKQHGGTMAPAQAGVTSKDTMAIMAGGHTIDQYAAQLLGGGSRFQSIQARVQALPYNGNQTSINGIMSAKLTNGSLSALSPTISPLQLYNLMFGGSIPTPTATPRPTATPTPAPTATPRPTATPTPAPTATPRPTATPMPTATPRPTATPMPTATPRPTATPMPTATPRPSATPQPTPTATPRPTATPTPAPTTTPAPTPNPTPSMQLLKKKSVLDLVLDDSKRLSANLSGEDKARLEQHFEEIRNIEKSVAATLPNGGTVQKLSNVRPLIGSGSCAVPASPGTDPAIGGTSFGSWSNETLRGEVQADLIAYALACDLTRAASWMLTCDQCWINSNKTSGSTTLAGGNASLPDIHGDSHFAPAEFVALNADWAASMYGRLVHNLSVLQDGGGSLLNNSVVTLWFAEGPAAHSKQDMRFLYAGMPSKLKIGEYIKTTGHPAQAYIAMMQALGFSSFTKLGEVSGALGAVLK